MDALQRSNVRLEAELATMLNAGRGGKYVILSVCLSLLLRGIQYLYLRVCEVSRKSLCDDDG